MSIAIHSTYQPEEVDFLNNPIAFVVEGGNYIISLSSAYYRRIQKSGSLTIGDTIVFSLWIIQSQ